MHYLLNEIIFIRWFGQLTYKYSIAIRNIFVNSFYLQITNVDHIDSITSNNNLVRKRLPLRNFSPGK